MKNKLLDIYPYSMTIQSCPFGVMVVMVLLCLQCATNIF